jgi:hypothetical protein
MDAIARPPRSRALPRSGEEIELPIGQATPMRSTAAERRSVYRRMPGAGKTRLAVASAKPTGKGRLGCKNDGARGIIVNKASVMPS